MEGWEQVRGESAGTWATGPRHPKLVLHTIEGRNADSALNAYKANRSWPHATVDPVRRRRIQHVPLNQPARALRNAKGGVETGRASIVIQVEIVGFAGESHTWARDDLDWLGSAVVGPLCRMAGIPIRTSVDFHGEGAGWVLASTSARQRLSGPAWLAYEGVLGHQHVPENTHWDPGALDIDRVLAAASGAAPAPPPEPEKGWLMALTDEQQAELYLWTKALFQEVVEPRDDKGKTRMDRIAELVSTLKPKG